MNNHTPPNQIPPRQLAALSQQAAEAAPAWITQMRAAAMAKIGQKDIEEIVQNQVDAAKKGDRNAIRFVFEQILGGRP